MIRRMIVFSIAIIILISGVDKVSALDSGLFRTTPATTPEKGTVWLSNTTFLAPVPTNSVLGRTYGLSDSRLLNSLSSVSLGVTNHLALTGTMPFYADLFSQGSRSGDKTGPGDASLGLRVAFHPGKLYLDRFSFGGGVCIPERLGYGAEPLGFRVFSTGELAYNAEMSFGFSLRFFEAFLSTGYHTFPKNDIESTVSTTDVFYESSYGYLGIGAPDENGLTSPIFQDHFTVTTGVAVPVKSWISGIVELSFSRFTEIPVRDNIFRVAPGIRFGNSEKMHINAGVDFRIDGAIPDRTYLMQVTIPFLQPKTLMQRPGGIGDEDIVPEYLVRSRNSLVAVKDFSSSDKSFIYQKELKHKFSNELKSMGIMDVINEERVRNAFDQAKLVPGKDTHVRLGVRLGANYIINAEISKYSVERSTSMKIPRFIGFPKTTFQLAAQTSVTDLVSGKTHDLGVITAEYKQKRGVHLFPGGESSDIIYLTEPERRLCEKELINMWVEKLNGVILDNLDVFGWVPKRTDILGDEDVKG